MWDYIVRQNLDIDPENTIVVGDDPWSEGSFAATCGLHCWIVDRMDRFSTLGDTSTYQRVRSLLEIPV
jgi:FMN phosphatase YigB (HAD superfamily)